MKLARAALRPLESFTTTMFLGIKRKDGCITGLESGRVLGVGFERLINQFII